jgi:hypothetical protein
MKTKFFKKLSFVLAVAMVLSVFAPAAGAFAAGEPKLNSTKKYLHLSGKPGSNEFNFNIKNKVKGWKYFWESADEAVAEVNEKNGVVTATGVGKTKITCTITDADGEEVAELVATVVVRDNIESVSITNKPEGDKVSIGKEHDFNRGFVTEAASTKKTSSIVRWTTEPAEGASIDDKGVFVATKAGDYKIVARAFQSKEKYNTWKVDPEKYAEYVLDTDEYTVKVPVEVVSVEAVSVNEVAITFNAATTAPTDLVVRNETSRYNMVQNGAPVVSTDGTVVTAKVYDNLVSGSDYSVSFGGETYPFSVKFGAIKEIVLNDQTIQANTPKSIVYKILDENNVDVTALYPFSKFTVVSTRPFSGGQLVLGNGEVAFVTLEYITGYDDKGVPSKITSRQAIITGVNASYSVLDAWTIGSDYDNIRHATNKGLNEVISARAKMTDGSYYSAFVFESLSPTILIVNAADGTLQPVNEGTATVKVIDPNANNKVVEYIQVSVNGEKKANSLGADVYSKVLSRKISDSESITFTLYDQFGAKFESTGSLVVSLLDGDTTNPPSGANTYSVTSDHSYTVTFGTTAGVTKAGNYRFKVEFAGKTTYVLITVVDAGNVVGYRVVPSVSEIDAKYVSSAKTVTFGVYGVDASGYKSEVVTHNASGAAVTYKVTDPDNQTFTDQAGVAHNNLNVTGSNVITISNGVNKESGNGTYTIKVKINNVEYYGTFVVKNSRTAPTVTIKATKTSVGSSVLNAVKAVMDPSFGNITGVKYFSYNTNVLDNDATTGGTKVASGDVSLYVESVLVTDSADSKVYEVKIGTPITIDLP